MAPLAYLAMAPLADLAVAPAYLTLAVAYLAMAPFVYLAVALAYLAMVPLAYLSMALGYPVTDCQLVPFEGVVISCILPTRGRVIRRTYCHSADRCFATTCLNL